MLPPGSASAGLTIAALVLSPPTIALIASVTGSEMPWFGTTGVAGLLGFLLWWHMQSGDKRTAKAIEGSTKTMSEVKTEISGMRDDLKEGQDTTNSLLREALFGGKGPK